MAFNQRTARYWNTLPEALASADSLGAIKSGLRASGKMLQGYPADAWASQPYLIMVAEALAFY